MIRIGKWILCSQRAGDLIYIHLRLLARHAGLQARQDIEVVTVTIIETDAVRDGDPNFSVIWQLKYIGYVWDHADDSKTLAIQFDCLADDLRIRVEATPPQSLAHDDREDVVRIILFRQ